MGNPTKRRTIDLMVGADGDVREVTVRGDEERTLSTFLVNQDVAEQVGDISDYQIMVNGDVATDMDMLLKNDDLVSVIKPGKGN